MRHKGFYQKYFKRFFDVVLSSVALILFSPVLLILAILIAVKLGRPVLFIQKRPGMNNKIFKLIKFRTMTDKKSSEGTLLPDEERLTRFGKKLRSLSLDELPSLINVLKGDMSLIGPRPLLVEYLPLYTDTQKRRHEVRPGLSGLAQVNGRNSLSWGEKFNLDVSYVDQVTFLGDLKLMFLTVGKVLKREGISSKDSVTMEKFKGNM
jgi:lipopolysaccharide/colanic/teichoic acid biosynthesis glycosyltransferase